MRRYVLTVGIALLIPCVASAVELKYPSRTVDCGVSALRHVAMQAATLCARPLPTQGIALPRGRHRA